MELLPFCLVSLTYSEITDVQVGLANQSCVRGSLCLDSTALHCVARINSFPIARSVLKIRVSDINYLTIATYTHGASQRVFPSVAIDLVFSPG